MKNINVGFPIDLEKLIATRALIQANSGGGKSYLMRKFIEEVHGKVPFIVLDMEGEFISIREKYDVIIFGKGHDIPINIQHAEKIAHYLLELKASAIIDMSELKKHERILFVKRFVDSMIEAPKKLWHPTLVFLDEAHEFCPEDGKVESMSAVIDLCTRGRKRGYCAILATQRISKLKKDAVAELNNKLIGRTGMDVDVKRTAFELGMSNNDAQRLLPHLNEGEFYVFGPAISREVKKQQISKVHTTHIKIGMKFTKLTPPSNAIQKLISKISEIPKEVEKELDTIKELQDQIQQLKKAARNKPAPAAITTVTNTGETMALKQHIALLKKSIEQHEARVTTILSRLRKVKDTSNAELEALLQLKPIEKVAVPVKAESVAMPVKTVRVPESNRVPAPFHEGGTSSSKLGKCEKAILIVLAQTGKECDKNFIAIRSGYSVGGNFKNCLGKLRTLGFIEGYGESKITEAGLEALGNYAPLPQPGTELQQFWIKELGKCEGLILQHLIDIHPNIANKESIAQSIGYDVGGNFKNCLGKLRTLQLIEGRGELKASNSLFE